MDKLKKSKTNQSLFGFCTTSLKVSSISFYFSSFPIFLGLSLYLSQLGCRFGPWLCLKWSLEEISWGLLLVAPPFRLVMLDICYFVKVLHSDEIHGVSLMTM